MASSAWEVRTAKLSPETEAMIESAVQQREMKRGTMSEADRESYKAKLRHLVALTLAYDA